MTAWNNGGKGCFMAVAVDRTYKDLSAASGVATNSACANYLYASVPTCKMRFIIFCLKYNLL